MKRERGEGSSPQMAAVVRLIVGGQPFDTTKDTLKKCRYFFPYLDGRMDHATDEQGRLSLDRDGEYFFHILQFMRTT